MKMTQLLAYGARLDLKLAAPSEKPLAVLLQFTVRWDARAIWSDVLREPRFATGKSPIFPLVFGALQTKWTSVYLGGRLGGRILLCWTTFENFNMPLRELSPRLTIANSEGKSLPRPKLPGSWPACSG